eukprot:1874589-Rhodomonas_salina.1
MKGQILDPASPRPRKAQCRIQCNSAISGHLPSLSSIISALTVLVDGDKAWALTQRALDRVRARTGGGRGGGGGIGGGGGEAAQLVQSAPPLLSPSSLSFLSLVSRLSSLVSLLSSLLPLTSLLSPLSSPFLLVT